MYSIGEVSRMTGLSVRALHHYDAIGLLHPTLVSESGYRSYDDAALARLQRILLYRELRFPLESIRQLLDNPSADLQEMLREQIRLLRMEQERLGAIIESACTLLENGGRKMSAKDFEAFDASRQEACRQEVMERWGHTAAWQEYAARNNTARQNQEAGLALMDLFAEFGALQQLPAEAPQVQQLVARLQEHITAHYYTCTKEILQGLGEMYTGDDRFRRNIDKKGGEGTAEFASRAIAVYCRS